MINESWSKRERRLETYFSLYSSCNILTKVTTGKQTNIDAFHNMSDTIFAWEYVTVLSPKSKFLLVEGIKPG
jgi:hypothetical protein